MTRAELERAIERARRALIDARAELDAAIKRYAELLRLSKGKADDET